MDGFEPADSPEEADLVVVNTCAFIEAARQESIDTVLALSDARRGGARLVVTGCMAERYGDELAEALPEVDLVAPFGTALVTAGPSGPPSDPGGPRAEARRRRDALERPSPRSTCSTCPGRLPPPPGPTSRWPRGATGTAGSVPSRRSGGSSGRAPPSRSSTRWTSSDGPGGRCGGGPGGPGPVVVRPRPVGPGPSAARRPGGAGEPPDRRPGGRGGGTGPLDPPALPLPVHPRRRAGRGHPGHRRALLRPFPPARVAAAAQAHAPLG